MLSKHNAKNKMGVGRKALIATYLLALVNAVFPFYSNASPWLTQIHTLLFTIHFSQFSLCFSLFTLYISPLLTLCLPHKGAGTARS